MYLYIMILIFNIYIYKFRTNIFFFFLQLLDRFNVSHGRPLSSLPATAILCSLYVVFPISLSRFVCFLIMESFPLLLLYVLQILLSSVLCFIIIRPFRFFLISLSDFRIWISIPSLLISFLNNFCPRNFQ